MPEMCFRTFTAVKSKFSVLSEENDLRCELLKIYKVKFWEVLKKNTGV